MVEIQDINYAKQIAELQLARKNLMQGLTQSKYSIRRIRLELKQLERAKWQALKAERGY